MCSYSEDEALKLNLLDMVSEDKQVEALFLINKLKHQNIESFETHRIAKDGKQLNVSLTATRLGG